MFELASGTLQGRALVVLVVLTVISCLFFLVVALQSRKDIPKERVAGVGYGFRTYWAAFLVSVLTIAGVYSFMGMPYVDTSDTTSRADMTISTMQYAFIPSPASVPAGPVRIEVSSVDVNHGVGIYSPDGVLIAQVQAMPGKTNILETELDEPGAYQLLCMEYCGLAHHQMRGVITVTDAATKDRKS